MLHTYVSPDALNTAVSEYTEWYATNYVGFAGFTALLWDHIITFPLEVELIWKEIWKDGGNPRRMKPLLYLFLINRYLTPLGFIINLFAYLSQDFEYSQCKHFVRFEGSMTMIGIDIVAMMMFLRIYALYHQQKTVIYLVAALLAVMIIVNVWALTIGEPVGHSSDLHACTMIFRADLSNVASSTAWLPLLYDTVVICLTLFKTVPELRKKDQFHIWRRLLEDGLIYYSAIFTVTAVLTGMIIKAPPGLKNVTAQLELLVTVMMMSRITLNLKRSGRKERVNDPGHISALIYASPTTPRGIQDVPHVDARKDPLRIYDPEDAGDHDHDLVLDITDMKHSRSVMQSESATQDDVSSPSMSGRSASRLPASYVSPYRNES